MSGRSQLLLFGESTSSAEASPVRTSRPQALAEALMASARASGVSSLVSSRSFGRDTSSSRTSPPAPSSGSTPWCATWGSAAMTAYRSRCRRRASEPHTGESGSSSSDGEPQSYPTPLARDSEQGVSEGRNSPSMVEVAALFPTPTAHDAKNTGPSQMGRNSLMLTEVAALFPTPTATRYGTSNNGDPHDGREEYATKGKPSLDSLAAQWPTAVVSDAESAGRHTTETGVMHPGTSLTDALRAWSTHLAPATWRDGSATLPPAGRRPVLSPRFVEALMGFPRGWLALGESDDGSTSEPSRPSATASCPSVPKSRAGSSGRSKRSEGRAE